jgi:hypothetical protein
MPNLAVYQHKESPTFSLPLILPQTIDDVPDAAQIPILAIGRMPTSITRRMAPVT